MEELISTIPESGRVPSGETNALPEPPRPPSRVDMLAMEFRKMLPQYFGKQIPADGEAAGQTTMNYSR